MSEAKVQNQKETTNPAPSAVHMAEKLIKSHPELFKNDYATLLTIADAMFEYHLKVNKYSETPSIFDRMASN